MWYTIVYGNYLYNDWSNFIMKKTFGLAILLICIIALVGCSETGNTIISGRYQMNISSENEFNIPYITFNAEENTFVFTMDLLSSYSGLGDFSIDDNIITAVTYDDEPNTYIFEIIDNDTLSFNVNQSSKLLIIDENIAMSANENITFIKTDD